MSPHLYLTYSTMCEADPLSMKKGADGGVVLPSPLPQDDHKGHFYFERIVSVILMGKGPGEITSKGADDF